MIQQKAGICIDLHYREREREEALIRRESARSGDCSVVLLYREGLSEIVSFFPICNFNDSTVADAVAMLCFLILTPALWKLLACGMLISGGL